MATVTVSTTTNYSSLTIANDDTLTVENGGNLTIDTSTVDLRQLQNITFGEININNSSTTTPIFINIGSTSTTNRRIRIEAGAIMRARGDYIQIGTGTGVAGQVVNLPQDAGLNNCPDLGGLWVDHGDTLRDGTPVDRPYLQVDTTLNAITLPKVSEIFTQDTVANTVTFGPAIPNGAAIYMNNIVIKHGASISVGDTPTTDFSNSGTLDLEHVHWASGWSIAMQNAKSLRMITCSIARTEGNINFQNQVLAPEFRNCVMLPNSNSIGLNFSNSTESGIHTNCWVDTYANVGACRAYQLTTTSKGYFEACRATSYGHTNRSSTENNNGSFYLSNAVDMKFYDCAVSTMALPFYLIGGSANVRIDNTEFMHGNYSTDIESEQLNGIRLGQCSDVIVTKYYHQDPAVYGGIQFSNDGILIAGGTVEATFDDCRFYAGSGVMGSVVNETGLNCRYNNITVIGTCRERIIDFQTASLNASFSNIRTSVPATQTQNCELGAGAKIDQIDTGRSSDNISTGAVGTGTNCLSALFYRYGDTDKTTGRLYTRMSPTTADEPDYYTVITQNGQIVFNNNNYLYMDTIGDQIELEGRVHPNIIGATSFQVQGSQAQNFKVEFALRRPNGAYQPYYDTDLGNVSGEFNSQLAALDADAQNRIQIKYRITREVANFTNYLYGIYFNVDMTGDDYPFAIAEADFTLTDLQPNSEVRVYDGATEILGVENSGTEFSGTYSVPYVNGAAGSINATIIIHSLGYVPIRLENVTLGAGGFSLPVVQRIDRNFSNP